MTRTMQLTLIGLVAGAVSCGGGGGGGTIGPSPPPVAASFVPDPNAPAPATALTVTMAQGSATDDLVSVQVSVAGTSGIYAAAFDVMCDALDGCNPSSVEFVQPSAGSVLEQGGNVPNYTATARGVWPVVIGASRSGAVAGVNVTAPQALLNLVFRVREKGSFKLKIQNAALIDGARQPIPGTSWYAGSLQGS